MCVVWTGVWQAVVVIAGSTGVVVSGWQDKSMDRASVGWSPDTHDILHTLAMCSGQTILWASVSGCHQAVVHRYSSAKSVVQARWMLGVTIFLYWLLSIGVVLSVMVIISKYEQSHQNIQGIRLEQAVVFFSTEVFQITIISYLLIYTINFTGVIKSSWPDWPLSIRCCGSFTLNHLLCNTLLGSICMGGLHLPIQMGRNILTVRTCSHHPGYISHIRHYHSSPCLLLFSSGASPSPGYSCSSCFIRTSSGCFYDGILCAFC